MPMPRLSMWQPSRSAWQFSADFWGWSFKTKSHLADPTLHPWPALAAQVDRNKAVLVDNVHVLKYCVLGTHLEDEAARQLGPSAVGPQKSNVPVDHDRLRVAVLAWWQF